MSAGTRRIYRQTARYPCSMPVRPIVITGDPVLHTPARRVETIDHDRGPANCWAFSDGGHDHIIAANRETNEVALYDCSK